MSKLAVLVLFLVTYGTALATQSLADQGMHHAGSVRIVGGKVVPAKKYPFMAFLRSDRKFLCGGTILNNLWILTAAQCTFRKPYYKIEVVVGTTNMRSGGIINRVAGVYKHPKFNNTGYLVNDVAMLLLETPLKFSATVAPVILNAAVLYVVDVTVLGWGYTTDEGPTSNELRELSTKTISHMDCRQYRGYEEKLNEDQICTKLQRGKRIGKADFGGPLIETKSKMQVGIASLSTYFSPDTFVRISSYIDWIKKTGELP
ncbi:hypothetical protein Trydic_g14568 [Trypoxylus dichotomus]